MTVIRSYKMTHDSGFAPNPYNGCLTLATCKSGIRRCHQVGEWLAGFTSKTLNNDKPGQERLIYLAKVSQKMEIKDYYEKYPNKRPGQCPKADNIYKWENGKYHQLKNPFHGDDSIDDDVAGKNVLIADEFYYFGKEVLTIPENIRNRNDINIPKVQAAYGVFTKGQAADDFIAWVKSQAAILYPGKKGKFAEPHDPK